MVHVLIALLISGVFMWIGKDALPYVGALGYVFREQAQYEEKKKEKPFIEFDWMGLVMPLLACILLAWIL
jgi:hypothetical protein